jgi:nitroreductase
MNKSHELSEVIQKAISKSQHCQRNWDIHYPIPQSDIDTLVHAVTQAPSKQNVAHYKVTFIQDRKLIESIYESTSGFYTKDDQSESEKNSQVLANILVVFETYDMANARSPEHRAFHSHEDTPEQMEKLMDRDMWTSTGIASGMLVMTANMLGYRTGFCSCFDYAEIKEKLGMPEDRDPVMMIGIGKGIKGQLRMVSQDNNYKYPVFHKQPIPVEFK